MIRRPAPRLASLAALLLVACGVGAGGDARERAPLPRSVVDDGGYEVRVDAPATRVLSLVPSGTDIVVALDAVDRLVGRTRYDVGREVAHLPSIGGGLDPSAESILALRPDLVIVWDTDASGGMRAQLHQAGVASFALQSRDTADVYAAAERLGVLLGREAAATALVEALRDELDAVRRSVSGTPSPRVLYAISLAPPMVAGARLFMGQLVGVAGGELLFAELDQASPTVSPEELVRRDPDVIVLPAGDDTVAALARLRAAPGWREIPAVREGRVVLMPVDLSNRPGPAMGVAARRLRDGFAAVWPGR